MIRLEQVSKRYGSFEALRGLSFELKPGETVAFLGPNGAGKTTAMRLIAGSLQPEAGRVWTAGMDMARETRAAQRRLGYLPENNPLYPDMTPLEYLEIIGALRGLRRAALRRAVAAAIEACNLGAALKKPIGALSKGYRQRVGFAQTLLHDPEVLALDEPTTGLDPNQLRDIKRLFLEIGASKTVLLSTHILDQVPDLCSRALILHRGALVYDGPPCIRAARLTVNQPPETASAWLADFPFVQHVATEAERDGFWRYTARGDWNEDRAADAFERLRALDWRVGEWTLAPASLESLFAELTAEAGP